jgi:uncharacterized protein
MGTLKEQLRADLTAAIKGRDELRAATLRMALTALTTEEVAGREQRELRDEEVLAVLRRETKKRREAAAAYAGADRPELAEREEAERRVLEAYLPAALPAARLAELVAAAIRETGATGPQAMGAVMKAVQPRVAGRAEGGAVAAEVRRQLAGTG